MTKPKPKHELAKDREFQKGVDRAVSHTLAAARLVRVFRETLPPGVGCLVLTFDYTNHGHMGYASTGQRDDCIRLVREFLANFEGS
jgi:hypothetical protein